MIGFELDRQQRQFLALWRQGYDANDTAGHLNDLWEFNPSTNGMGLDGRKQHGRQLIYGQPACTARWVRPRPQTSLETARRVHLDR